MAPNAHIQAMLKSLPYKLLLLLLILEADHLSKAAAANTPNRAMSFFTNGGRWKITAQYGSNLPPPQPRPKNCPPGGNGGVPVPQIALSLDSPLGVVAPVLLGGIFPFLPNNFAATIWTITVLTNSVWNAMVPFHPTAKPIVPTGIPKQNPTGASNTLRDMNTAIAYTILRVAEEVSPGMAEGVSKAFQGLGLDPSNACTNDYRNPACVGNAAAGRTIAFVDNLGWNRDGSIDQTYNRNPYNDYTHWIVNNSAYVLKDIYDWQPLLETDRKGSFWIQTPFPAFLGELEPIVFSKTFVKRQFVPYRKPAYPVEYKRDADEVLGASTTLNDTKKVLGESLIFGTGVNFPAAFYLADKMKWDLPTMLAYLQINSFWHDLAIIIGQNKVKFHSVRPPSAVRQLYGNKPVNAYRGPGQGIGPIPGNEWLPYMPIPNDVEFPSGTACLCVGLIEWMELFLKTDQINLPYNYPAGCSTYEPGITPKSDVTGVFKTTTDLVEHCKEARVWVGAHFRQAIVQGDKLCRGLAKPAYDWLQKLLAGA